LGFEMMEAHKPKDISVYAESCLEALSTSGLGKTLSLGGAFGLAHYHEYRSTHDVDAWWHDNITEKEKKEVAEVISKVLSEYGETVIRSWGDVVSVELKVGNNKVFSFQIAARSALLEPTRTSPWPGIGLDDFPDLVASKMTALVERGAPRDFRDVFTLCQNNLTNIPACWEWWVKRQMLCGNNPDRQRATLAVETHLERIALQRPLERIDSEKERQEAASLRSWFLKEFLHG